MPKVKPRDGFTQYFESTERIIENASVGDKVTLIVKGKIKSLEEREQTDYELVDGEGKSEEEAKYTNYEMGVEISSIEYPYSNEFAKLAEVSEDEET